MVTDSLPLSGFSPFSLRGAGMLVGAAVIYYCVYCIWVVIYNFYFHPLRDFPGPWTRTGMLFFNHLELFKGDGVTGARKLHDQYGDVVRLTPNALSFRTFQAVKDIYGPKPGPGRVFKDPMFYKLNSQKDILNANDADHARFRRLMSHAFSDAALQQQETIMNRYFSLLIQRLSEQAADPQTGGVVDMVRWYNFTTFDLIGDLAFGEPFGSLRDGEYHPWISSLLKGIKFGSRVGRIARAWPGFGALMKLLIRCVPSLGAAMKRHHNFAREKIERRLEAKTDRKDFMSYILRHNDERGMTREEMANNAGILVLAGSETTASLLSGATYFLLAHPAALAQVTAEVREAFATADDMTLNSTAKLTYLNAVLEESLRLYPPVAGFLPRRTGDKGNVINGVFVPAHSIVGVTQFAAYHAERNFRDPDAFVPERWLDPPPEEYRDDDRAVLKPFSFGPRNCLGQHLAYSEMRSIMARVLWHFDLELQPQSRNWSDHKVHTLWDKPPLMVKLSKRVAS